MPENVPAAPRVRRRHVAATAGVAVLAGTLFAGASLARAAETAPPASLASSSAATPGSGTSAGGTVATIPPTTVSPAAGIEASSTSVATGASAAVQQNISMTVLPGTMTESPAAETVSLAPQPVLHGSLSTITVNDYRGSLAGWDATVSLQSVGGLSASQVARARLCVSPHTPTMVEGDPADVVRAAPHSCAGAGQALPVFFAAPGGGGGTYTDVADVVLVVPDQTGTAPVTADLALAVH